MVVGELAPDLHPMQAAVRPDDTVFDVVIGAGRDRRGDRIRHALPVVRVDRRPQVFVAERIFGAASENGLAGGGRRELARAHVELPGTEAASLERYLQALLFLGQIGDDAAEDRRVAVRHGPERQPHGKRAAALADEQGELSGPTAVGGPEQVLEGDPLAGGHEALQGRTDDPLVRHVEHLGQALVAIEHRSIGAEHHRAFLHLLDKEPIGAVGALERVDLPTVLAVADDEGVDVAAADGVDGLLRLAQALVQLGDLAACGLQRVLLRSNRRRGVASRIHGASSGPGWMSRLARTRSSSDRSPMMRRSGAGSILTSVGAAMICASREASGF